jgi:hypothetical protein
MRHDFGAPKDAWSFLSSRSRAGASEREYLSPSHELAGEHEQVAPQRVGGEGFQGRFFSPVSLAFRIRPSQRAQPVADFEVSELAAGLVYGESVVGHPVDFGDAQLGGTWVLQETR